MFKLFEVFGEISLRGANAADEGLRRLNDRAGKMADRLDKGAERVGKFGSSLTRSLTAPVAGAATALGGFLGLLANDAAQTGREIERLARISSTSTYEFQRLAAGARTLGFDNEKLADIYRDVNDRVGDFLATGAGPMADFFENIAPKVGVTADQFARLSGPEALQLYVDSLQKAGVDQQQMVFYLEAMASNSSDLIPLLQNNGEEMRRLGDEYERTGRIMDDEAIAASQRYNASMRRLQDRLGAVRQDIGVRLLPLFTRFVEYMEGDGVDAVVSVVDALAGLVTGFADMDTTLQLVIAGVAAFLVVLGPVLTVVANVMKLFAGLLRAARFLAPAFAALKVVFGIVAAGVAAVGAPVAAVIAALALLGSYLFLNREKVGEWAIGVTRWVREAWQGFLQFGNNLIRGTGEWLAGVQRFAADAGAAFGEWVSSVLDLGKELARGIGSSIADMAKSVLSSISDMVSGALSKLRGLYKSAVGNSIIPDLARDVTKVVGDMADKSISETQRMGDGMTAAMDMGSPVLTGVDSARGVQGITGGSGGTVQDFRHATFNTDSALNRLLPRSFHDMIGDYS